MATIAAMLELDGLLDDVNRLTQRDLLALWRAVSDRDPMFVRDAFVDTVPDIVIPYSDLAADLSASWYEELDQASSFDATPAPPPPIEQVEESARWAANAAFRPGVSTPIDCASQAAHRMLFNTSRATIRRNSAREGVLWARVTRGDAKVCPFCRILASRGYAYGADAHGASQGERFHDNCRCRAVPNRGGSELPDSVSLYEQQYADAVAATSVDGSVDIAKVMAHMRAHL